MGNSAGFRVDVWSQGWLIIQLPGCFEAEPMPLSSFMVPLPWEMLSPMILVTQWITKKSRQKVVGLRKSLRMPVPKYSLMISFVSVCKSDT